MLGLLSMLSIGIFVLPVGVIAVGLLAAGLRSRSGWAGAVSGAGLPFLYVGLLNLGGPSTCAGSGVMRPGDPPYRCVEKWSPLPWLAIAAVLVGVGIVLHVAARRRARRRAGIVPTGPVTPTAPTAP